MKTLTQDTGIIQLQNSVNEHILSLKDATHQLKVRIKHLKELKANPETTNIQIRQATEACQRAWSNLELHSANKAFCQKILDIRNITGRSRTEQMMTKAIFYPQVIEKDPWS